jgi:hypothetical protein
MLHVNLDQLNPHPRDAYISFIAATHVYTVDESKLKTHGDTARLYTSVTTVVKSFFTPFDPIAVATSLIRRPKFRRSKLYKQYHQLLYDNPSDDAIICRIGEMWTANGRTQAELGTKLHEYIEDIYNKKCSMDQTAPVEYQQFHDFYLLMMENDMVPYRTEWRIFDEEYNVCGTIDMLFFNTRTRTYHMVDWKRSKKISKFSFKKNGLRACNKIPDSNYYHYMLQQNMYKYILEKHYNIKIMDMSLAVFHPNQTTYDIIIVEERQALITNMLSSALNM